MLFRKAFQITRFTIRNIFFSRLARTNNIVLQYEAAIRIGREHFI